MHLGRNWCLHLHRCFGKTRRRDAVSYCRRLRPPTYITCSGKELCCSGNFLQLLDANECNPQNMVCYRFQRKIRLAKRSLNLPSSFVTFILGLLGCTSYTVYICKPAQDFQRMLPVYYSKLLQAYFTPHRVYVIHNTVYSTNTYIRVRINMLCTYDRVIDGQNGSI